MFVIDFVFKMNLNLLNNLINSQQNNLMHAVDLAGKDFVYKVFNELGKSTDLPRFSQFFLLFLRVRYGLKVKLR